jgi:hypothetical protein
VRPRVDAVKLGIYWQGLSIQRSISSTTSRDDVVD